MLDLRDLQCAVALDEFRHFARAAESCGLSQPAFSMRISGLEDQLNITLVKRGNRFKEFTPEGEAFIVRARAILESIGDLEDSVRKGRGEVSGALVLGVIPTAVGYAAKAAIQMRRRHEGVRVRILTANSLRVQQGLEDGHFDVGLTYSDGVSGDLLRVEPVYDEEYVALVPKAMADPESQGMTWAELSELPLALLDPSMQNRRIVNKVFQDAGLRPDVSYESNGFNAAILTASAGVAATVVPKGMIEELGLPEGTTIRPLNDPVVTRTVSLVSPFQPGKGPLVNAFRASAAADLRLAELIEPS